MTDERDTFPLTAGPSTDNEVRQMLLWAGADDAPSQEQLDRLAARVAPAVGLPLGALTGAAVPPPPVAAGGSSLAPGATTQVAATGKLGAATALKGKLGLGALAKVMGLAGAVGLGVVGYSQWAQPQPDQPVELPAATRAAPMPASERQVAEPTVTLLPSPVSDMQQAAEAPSAPVEAVTRRKQSASRRQAPSAPSVAAAQKPGELQLMDQAQAERAQPRAMLRTLAQHARFYPAGMLAQERDVLRIEALVKLGRHAEAERLAAAMERTHPGSPHLRRVRALLQPAGTPN